jgi:transcription initiation factor TFIIH subunit 4
VETNFKVYAYTTSTLHIAMLSVFVDIVTRLPNLAVGFITRESLRSALIHGISAQQIYDFLMKHIHPKMASKTPIIPENIADQLYLWEHERNRLSHHEGMFFEGFHSKEDYEKIVAYAKALSVLTWEDGVNYKLAVSKAGEEGIRQYIREQLK